MFVSRSTEKTRRCDESKVSTILPSIIADIFRLHFPVFRYEDLEPLGNDSHYDTTLMNIVDTHVRLITDTTGHSDALIELSQERRWRERTCRKSKLKVHL